MSDPAGYTVGWICALPVEYIAAQEFLDEEHEKTSSVSPNDANDYTLGKMGEHNVVIAVLPDGEYGTASATSVATNMLNNFHNIRIGLMVGIGGGVPSESHDIRLGDVVVSAPRNGESGVFQYDFGKSIQGQSFQHTRFLNQPPTMLRTAMTGIRTRYERKGHQLEKAIHSILEKNPRLRRKYKRPEPIDDRLFHPEVIHSPRGCAVCADDPSNLVPRSERTDDEDNPAIHYGLIASGNQLMKDALIRDRLAAEKDVLCFEMEAAGLINTFPCLVIRGICDYSDSHKNKEWQGYAAMVAAAYAKDLLQRIPLNRIEAEERIGVVMSEELKGIQQRLDQAYSQKERHFSDQNARELTDQQRRCYQVFKIANYTEQKNINQKRTEGTCQWALQSPEYIRWWESNCNDLLWVSADPGCGKSVLARSIIDDYLEASYPSVRICYFFFKENDEQNDLATALCSVLHQLFSQQPHLLQYAFPSYEKNGETLRREVDELWRIFIVATSADISCKTICIFDALDECREIDQDRLIGKLQLFYHQSCSSMRETYLKFLLTSRPYDYIQNRFRAITDSFPYLHLKGEEENDQIHREINLVVKIRVKELAQAARLSSKTQQTLEHQLLQMEHRTYLWLYLAIDDIRTTFRNSLRPSKQTIEEWIPSSVNAAYEKILSRIPKGEVNTARKIFQIIVGARRPLTIKEMAMALGIALQPGCQFASQAGAELEHFEEKVRHLCGLFVFIKNTRIYLIHQTAREFLVRKESTEYIYSAYSCRPEDIENQMTEICLRYLWMEDLEKDLEKDEDDQYSDPRNFLDYSAIYWPDHVRNATSTLEPEQNNLLHRLYDTNTERFSLWFPLFWGSISPCQYVPTMEGIHLAAFNGHEQVVRHLLTKRKDRINTPDSTGSYPMTWASLEGYVKIVQMLLEHGADVNAQGGEYGNALHAASAAGHHRVVQKLLEHGADVNAHGGEYGNALQAASTIGYHRIVQNLLEHGADVNAQGGKRGNALYAACSRGYDKIVQILLEHGADVNAQGGKRDNALCAACSRGYDKIVQILLEHDADINAQGGRFENALYIACFQGHDKFVEKFLERGIDVKAQGRRLNNSLYVACSRGHYEVVLVLLERGADVNAQGGEYSSALYVACSRGHDKIVQVLLERGADVDPQSGYFINALEVACSRGNNKIVQMLQRAHSIAKSTSHDYPSKRFKAS